MQDEPTATPPAGEAQNCGCTCEFCMAGNHDQCQSGLCSVKTQPDAPKDADDEQV